MKRLAIISMGVVIFLLALVPAPALGYGFPTVIKGQTTITEQQLSGDVTYYGGWQGNEAVVNFYPDVLFGIDKSVRDCNLSEGYIPFCLFPVYEDSKTIGGLELMVGRTRIGNWPVDETAVLVSGSPPGSALTVGDTYNLNNFKYWGRNLAQSSKSLADTVDASWKLGNYQINNGAQSSVASEAYTNFKQKIEVLAKEAEVIPASVLVSSGNWYLQGKSDSGISGITVVGNGDKNKYPEGKVWVIEGDLKLDGSPTYLYHGQGTIIVMGRLTIADGISIKKADQNSEDDQLGLVSLISAGPDSGKCIIQGNNQIQAAIFCQNDLDVTGKSNIDFQGAVTAKRFLTDTGTINLRFLYDPKLGREWPPGFRYLQIPVPKESQ